MELTVSTFSHVGAVYLASNAKIEASEHYNNYRCLSFLQKTASVGGQACFEKKGMMVNVTYWHMGSIKIRKSFCKVKDDISVSLGL